ncbi:MAG TPA: response regulator [Planctomycetota bacterium]|nr:response regulator [Planctomycetota bacterium]
MHHRRSRPVILFVEPSLARHRRLRVALRRRGAHVMMASTAEEGLDRAELFPPDAIVVASGLRNTEGDSYATVFQAAYPGARLLPDDATLLSEIVKEFPSLAPIEVTDETSRILCVDDDPLYLKSLTRFLERYGYHVQSCTNPEQALASVQRLPPELAIVDVRMPGMDGIELARRIHELSHGQVPVVLLTALPIEETRGWGRQAGATCSISKQGVPDQVVDVIDSLIGNVDEDERAFLKIPG